MREVLNYEILGEECGFEGQVFFFLSACLRLQPLNILVVFFFHKKKTIENNLDKFIIKKSNKKGEIGHFSLRSVMTLFSLK